MILCRTGIPLQNNISYGVNIYMRKLIGFITAVLGLILSMCIAMGILGVFSILVSAIIVLWFEKNKDSKDGTEIDYRRLFDYNLGQAVFLIIMMAAYALSLRPLGFFISTITFLTVSGYALGERKIFRLFFIIAIASFIIWYLVEQVLGIYLRPLPSIF